MLEREKVVKGLEEISDYFYVMYHKSKDRDKINTAKTMCDMAIYAIALLTDTTSWVKEPNRRNHWHCEKCGSVVGLAAWMYTYCPVCGRRVTGGIEFDG